MKPLQIILAAVAVTGFWPVAQIAPSQAKDYPVCARGYDVGTDSLRCEFSNFAQCRASVSGVGGDCLVNPRLSGARGDMQAGGSRRR
jgi:hypothetical protein